QELLHMPNGVIDVHYVHQNIIHWNITRRK
ncbi:MAG: hypothetical protein ACI90V_014436, partial [Bacillariaceae sp.]